MDWIVLDQFDKEEAKCVFTLFPLVHRQSQRALLQGNLPSAPPDLCRDLILSQVSGIPFCFGIRQQQSPQLGASVLVFAKNVTQAFIQAALRIVVAALFKSFSVRKYVFAQSSASHTYFKVFSRARLGHALSSRKDLNAIRVHIDLVNQYAHILNSLQVSSNQWLGGGTYN